jgi:hypothetical protein
MTIISPSANPSDGLGGPIFGLPSFFLMHSNGNSTVNPVDFIYEVSPCRAA